MRVAVTCSGTDLNAEIDPRFGRAKRFLVVETDSLTFEVVDNQQNFDTAQGAGIQAAQNIMNAGAVALLTGNCGPKAFKVLERAGGRVVVGVGGRVGEAVRAFCQGKLVLASEPNVEGHW